MANAHSDNATKAVQVAATIVVEQVLRLALDNHDWIFVVVKNSRRQILLAHGKHFFRRGTGVWLWRVGEWWKLHFVLCVDVGKCGHSSSIVTQSVLRK